MRLHLQPLVVPKNQSNIIHAKLPSRSLNQTSTQTGILNLNRP
jgi:hypothetical protein